MQSWIKLLTTLGIIAFWVLMNTQLVIRQLEIEQLGAYPRGVHHMLKDGNFQENWMGIYRNNRKVGYTGYNIERVFDDEGVRHHMIMDTRVRVEILSRKIDLSLRGSAITDLQMLPLSLSLEVATGPLTFQLEGKRVEDRFRVRARRGDQVHFEQDLPLESLGITNGVTANIPLAGFEEGDTFEIPVFNPFSTGERQLAKVKVLEKTHRTVDGKNRECYVVETTLAGRSFRSWVTEDGQTLRQELPEPLDYVLIRESRRKAERGFTR